METLSPAPTPRPEGENTANSSSLIGFSRRLASGRLWAASTIAFVAFAVAFFTSEASFAIPTVEAACGQQPLDVRFTSSAAEVNGFLTACGPDGRQAYRSMQVADLFYPAVFGLFMATSLAVTITRVASDRRRLMPLAALLPFLGAGFDYLENVFAWSALRAFPNPAATDSLLGLASAAKTTTFWLSGALLLLTTAALAARTCRRLLSTEGPMSRGSLVERPTGATSGATN